MEECEREVSAAGLSRMRYRDYYPGKEDDQL
jgi:hypothetical protein